MKLNSKRDKRNYIIIALCMILVVMGVGYAAFSSLLTINGTANISNSWCLGFDNSKTNAYEITKGVSTGEAPTGTMTYSGDVCSTNLVPHSNLTAVFHQPGDQIEYTLTIKNASTVTAAIKSIKVDNQNITGNTTKTKGNITFTINFPAKTTLTSNETTTMTIIAKFQNETDVTGSFTGSESQTISVELNGEQDDGNGGIVPAPTTFSGTVYSWNTDTITVGTSQLTDLVSTKTTNPYYTSEADIQSALNGKTGSTIYNKYTVENDTITEGYACQTFGILSRAECIKMSTDGSEYGYDAGGNHTGNAGILKALQSNSTFTGASGSCDFGSYSSDCYVGNLDLFAHSSGYVSAHGDGTDANCYVGDDGYADCSE